MQRDSILSSRPPDPGFGYYPIRVSGRAVTVQLHASVIVGLDLAVGELRESLARGEPSQFGGVLLGRKAPLEDAVQEITVDDFERLPSSAPPEPARWAQELFGPRESSGTLSTVGCFFSSPDGALPDVCPEIVEQHFGGHDSAVLLLIQPHDGAPTGDLLLCRGGIPDPGSRTPFRLSLYELLDREPVPAVRTPGNHARREIARTRETPAGARSEPAFRIVMKKRALRVGGILVLALLGVFGSILFLYGSRALDPRLMRKDPDKGLGLAVSPSGTQLRLQWNRASPAIARAMLGNLSIIEAASRRDLTLTAADLQTGAIVYTPLSSDVTFVLSVRGPGETNSTESLRVVSGIGTPETAPVLPKPSPAQGGERRPPPQPRPVPPAVPTPSKPAPQGAGAVRAPEPEAGRESAATPPEPPTPSPGPALPAPSENPERKIEVTPPAVMQPAERKESKPPAAGGTSTEAPGKPVQVSPVPAAPGLGRPAAAGPSTLSPPVPLVRVVPAVPLSIKRALDQMSSAALDVAVKVYIDDQGKVYRVDRQGAAPRAGAVALLVEAAVEAARGWRFRPARLNGRPVPSEAPISFRFKPNSPVSAR